ncbi:hypothetical protein [Streptomyces mutabilis]|uniref:hypothetical protein n=1 Tax=Streptomyces mutabilis TaxID=67332 RepID=UPI0036AC08C6
MTGDKESHGLAAGAGRAAQPAENAHPRPRTGPIHWLLFNSTCVAASVSLMWLTPVIPLPGLLRGTAFLVSALLIPLALVLVPALLLRHIPHKKPPKLAIAALTVAIVSAVVLAVITRQASNEQVLQERGRWTEAVVIEVENRKTDKCTLRTGDGREISPQLSEGDGCEAERGRRQGETAPAVLEGSCPFDLRDGDPVLDPRVAVSPDVLPANADALRLNKPLSPAAQAARRDRDGRYGLVSHYRCSPSPVWSTADAISRTRSRPMPAVGLLDLL